MLKAAWKGVCFHQMPQNNDCRQMRAAGKQRSTNTHPYGRLIHLPRDPENKCCEGRSPQAKDQPVLQKRDQPEQGRGNDIDGKGLAKAKQKIFTDVWWFRLVTHVSQMVQLRPW